MEIIGATLFNFILSLICFFSWQICFREQFRNKFVKYFLLGRKVFEKNILYGKIYFDYENYVAQKEGGLLALAVIAGLISFFVLILVLFAQLAVSLEG